MDPEKTREYYGSLTEADLCRCACCENFMLQISDAYPRLKEYLESAGVDITMPFELFPLEPEPDGTILYPDAQYVIMGSSADFMPACIDGVDVRLAESHPVTDIDAPHFVIEAGPLRLKWIVRRD